MSMSTVYVLVQDAKVVDISVSLSAEGALEYFQTYGQKGELYAVRISDAAAFDVRAALQSKDPATATKRLKTYAHSMTKVGDA